MVMVMRRLQACTSSISSLPQSIGTTNDAFGNRHHPEKLLDGAGAQSMTAFAPTGLIRRGPALDRPSTRARGPSGGHRPRGVGRGAGAVAAGEQLPKAAPRSARGAGGAGGTRTRGGGA